MKSSTNKGKKYNVDPNKKKRFLVYEKNNETLVCEGTYDDIIRYIECNMSSITTSFRKHKDYAVVKGYLIYREE